MTDDAAKAMAEGLLSAMRAEHQGQHFYLMAAQTTEDQKGKEVFQRLAMEEQGHFEYLKAQYKHVLETGKADANLTLGPRSDLSGHSPIFSESLRSRVGEAHFEMTALAVGIQLELSAQSFYSQQASAATDPVVRRFFNELADWESGHYNALLAQQEELKEDYWAQGGFAPF